MQISSQEKNGVQVYVLEGRIDSTGARELDNELQTTIASEHYKLVLDMANVTYINSAGLRTLADILTQARSHEGDLRLVALSAKVERVFKIIGFDKFFESYADLEEATIDF
ncbi:MAG: STAS domain-containing protein [Anaerolineae bacterium]|nr:STAS domain-containing protein [Anaerolineae bacterium]